MVDQPPLMELPIKTADNGFYDGFSKTVTLTGKALIAALVIWAVAFPDNAGRILKGINGALLSGFATWYIWVVALFILACLCLALLPAAGRMRLGRDDERPEFSRFSWFSMMFGAGIGIGMLTFSTAEPMYHFATNPDVIQGKTTASGADNVVAAYKWSFFHWGLSAWASYAVIGLSLGYVAFRRNLPLTIRSALAPLFGRAMSGPLGHLVDIVAVVATVLGVAQTLGFGVAQFIAGLNRIGIGGWLLNAEGKATTAAILVALLVIMGASTLSALSGVGKGVKWLSNINMGLSFFLLAFFLIFGSTLFALKALGFGLIDYLASLPGMLFQVFPRDGTATGAALADWQGAWTVFYWAWWIAFAPFVGVFLARISRGRTVREYVLGAMVVPSVMCFLWFALVGGTAIDLTLNGGAGDAIAGAAPEAQLFAMLDVMLSPGLAWVMAILVVVLLLTYLVTSADSAVLIINTINSGGDEAAKGRPHILFWGIALALVVGALLLIGGLDAIQSAMVIGALPFSAVMLVMAVALIKGVIWDIRRERRGVATVYEGDAA